MATMTSTMVFTVILTTDSMDMATGMDIMGLDSKMVLMVMDTTTTGSGMAMDTAMGGEKAVMFKPTTELLPDPFVK